MINKRLIMIAGGTISCALSIGFILQNSFESSPAAVTLVVAAQTQTPTPAVIAHTFDPHPKEFKRPELSVEQPLVLNEIIHTSAKADVASDIVMSSNTSASTDLPQPPADPETPRLGCEGKVVVRSMAMANVDLEIESPCQPNERLTIHHSGLMFTGATDENGVFTATIPVLKEQAVFIIDFTTGQDLVATASVPDLKNYDRVVVQWSGSNGFEIHAREFGAGYGDAGHVWSGAMTDGASQGHVTKLGDDQLINPNMAEVYTFPRMQSTQDGSVALSVETEVTLDNCGQDISAQALEYRDQKPLRTRDMFLSMPNCSAVGDFLVLNNLLDDLRIAAN